MTCNAQCAPPSEAFLLALANSSRVQLFWPCIVSRVHPCFMTLQGAQTLSAAQRRRSSPSALLQQRQAVATQKVRCATAHAAMHVLLRRALSQLKSTQKTHALLTCPQYQNTLKPAHASGVQMQVMKMMRMKKMRTTKRRRMSRQQRGRAPLLLRTPFCQAEPPTAQVLSSSRAAAQTCWFVSTMKAKQPARRTRIAAAAQAIFLNRAPTAQVRFLQDLQHCIYFYRVSNVMLAEHHLSHSDGQVSKSRSLKGLAWSESYGRPHDSACCQNLREC